MAAIQNYSSSDAPAFEGHFWMVSIGKFINQKTDIGVQVLKSVAQAIARSAVDGEPGEADAFRSRLDEFAESLPDRMDADALRERTSQLMQTLEQYNQGITKNNHGYRTEMR